MARDVYFTTGQVANMCGVPAWKIGYLVERGFVDEPAQRIPGRRLFNSDELERIRAALRERAPTDSSASRRQPAPEAIRCQRQDSGADERQGLKK